MPLRRLVALLSSLAMLHLTVVVGEASCVTKTGTAVLPTAETHGHHTAPSETPRPDQPTQQQCCEAMIACTVVSDVTQARVLLADAAAPSMQSSSAIHDAPASFVAPPEPPPPKA